MSLSSKRITYTISPENKNCIYEEGHYSKQISTGKIATILYTTNWRWGSFEITLTEEEKKEVLESNDISLNSYGASCLEMDNGWILFGRIEKRNELYGGGKDRNIKIDLRTTR